VRYAVGVPQFEANEFIVPVQLDPPKLVEGVVVEPFQVARVTSVQEEEPAVLAVPLAQATQAVDDVMAVAPPRE